MSERPVKQLTAATYSRVSSTEQVSNNSLPSQERAMQKFAADKGYTIPDDFKFVDAGFSGAVLDRPALSRLREAVRARLVDAAVVFDLDRLARDLGHQILLLDEFEKYGAALEVVNGAIERTAEGRMLGQMRGMFSQYERAKIRERVTRGRRERALSGRPVPGAAPYGFEFKNGELTVVEHEAAVVRRIFHMVSADTPVSRIARILNEEGVKPRRAPGWTATTVGKLLRNETYVGRRFFNCTLRVEPVRRRVPKQPGKSPATSQRATPKSEWIATKSPAIVTVEQFEQARTRLERTRQLHVGRPSAKHMLRGLLKCEQCGAACRTFNSRGKTHYRCNRVDYLTGKLACRARKIPTERVEKAVWTKFCETIENPLTILDQLGGGSSKGKQTAAERTQVERDLEKLKQRERRAATALMNADGLASEESLRYSATNSGKSLPAVTRFNLNLPACGQRARCPIQPPTCADGDCGPTGILWRESGRNFAPASY